jgi:hypothetical protein
MCERINCPGCNAPVETFESKEFDTDWYVIEHKDGCPALEFLS